MPRVSEEDRALQRQAIKAYMERQQQAKVNLMAQQAPIQPATLAAPAVPAASESSIQAQIDQIPQLAQGVGVLFTKNDDGFTVNGERYIDFEGEITTYAFDGLTGNVTYLAKVQDNAYIIKFMRASVDAEPIRIGTANYSRNMWNVTTVTGKRLSGSTLMMTSKGFVVKRKGTGFLYQPGQSIKSIASPKGYRIAKYQTGDIASTGHILLEKLPEKESSFGSFFAATKGLGSIFGGEGNQDYALFNIQSKKLIPLFIGLEKANKFGKDNRYLYYNGGLKNPNSGHYFWRVEWFKVESGVYVTYVVNGIKEAKVIHLDTGLEKTIFERMLGISSVNAYIQKNGKIKVVADMGFSMESIDDLEAFMSKPLEIKD
ncbi:MAG: hypothetical protein Q9M19_06840 [Mariprofundaceae bacterium]|nr:hypothetical protein [Mariprofundaceae bacterium]